jgi:hypothetical protein
MQPEQPAIHRPDEGGSKHLWNVGKRLPGVTTQKTVIFMLANRENLKSACHWSLSWAIYVYIFQVASSVILW